MLDETAIRADYLRGLANLHGGEDLDGPDKGMYWLMPFAVAAGRAGGAYGQHLDWPDYESLSAGERKAVEMIRTCLSPCAVALVELINKFGLDAQGNPKGGEDGVENL